MLERKQRRWRFLTLGDVMKLAKEQTTESVWHDSLNDPMLVTSDRLSGQDFSCHYDDGTSYTWHFESERWLTYTASDGRSGRELYNASPAAGYPNVLLVHHYCSLPIPGCLDLFLDLDTGYTVLFDASLGHPDSPREVIRSIRFGTIDGITPDPAAEKPWYTNDLTGKAIRWCHPGTGGKGRGIKYIFSAYCYLTYVMSFPDRGICWIATNPCDQIKLRDDLYICSTIEERQTGVELIMLMNLSLMRDVQTEFGIGGPTEDSTRLETAMHSGREGFWTTMDTDLYTPG